MAGSRFESQFPWAEAIPGALLGLGVGAAVGILVGQRLGGVATSPMAFPDSWTYSYTMPSLLVMATLGGIVAALGFVAPADRQFFNYLLIGIGLGVLFLGTSFVALEKIEVTQDAIVHKSWWGLSRVELKFADMRQLRVVEHLRPWRRNSHWKSLHYKMHDGREGTLCNSMNNSGTFFWAQIHLRHSARQRGVQISHESDDGK